jgi:hypothetical protein
VSSIGNVARQAGLPTVKPRTVMDRLTRVGFLCKGVVYLLIGALALLAALHEGGETTDQRGVVQRIAAESYGSVALIVIAGGLLAYALWRFLCALRDCEGEGSDARGIANRTGDFISGLIYSGIAVYALKLLAGRAPGTGDATRSWTARLLDLPAGPLLVIVLGVIVVGCGLFQMQHGLQEGFRKHLRLSEVSAKARVWALRAGKWGYATRGVILGVMGGALIMAGLDTNARRAKGLEATLDTIAAKSYGDVVLAFVAAGLICYGLYCMFEARYRSVPQ